MSSRIQQYRRVKEARRGDALGLLHDEEASRSVLEFAYEHRKERPEEFQAVLEEHERCFGPWKRPGIRS